MEGTGCLNNRYITNNLKGCTTGFIRLVSATGSRIETSDVIALTLSATKTFYPGEGRYYILDPGGSARNVSPGAEGSYGPFPEGYHVWITNIADAAETLTFDPSGVNVGIAQGKSASFIYKGTGWRQITDVSP